MTGRVSGTSGNNPVHRTGAGSATGAQASSETVNIPMADANRDLTAEQQAQQKKDAAKAKLQDEISSGNATYIQTNLVGDIFGLVFDKKGGNYVDISGIPKGTTLGEVKRMYNLPDGSLRHMSSGGGGDFDRHTLNDGYVTIYVSDLKEALGISDRELKGMFPEKQFSPWYKLGTNE